jgi:peroxin-13
LFVFLLAIFGLPYLMGKLIKALAKNQEEEEARRQQANPQLMEGEQMDPNKLEFCRVLYDFSPDASNATVQGVDLAVKKGDLVAVLSKADPMGNASDWWRCRSRDGRMGYLPSPYLEPIQRRTQAQITSGTSPAGSRTHTLTTNAATSLPGSRTATLTGKHVEDLVKQGPEVKGKPSDITVESFQKGMFNS